MGISVGCIMLVSLIAALGTKTILDAQAEADKQRRTEEALRLAAYATAVDETEETTSETETSATATKPTETLPADATDPTDETTETEETSETSESETTTTTEATTESIGESELYMTVYAAEDMNLRTGPGTEYDCIRTLNAGDAIDVVAITDNGWYRTYNGNYVASGLTTTTPPVAPSTVPQTEATTAATTAQQTEAPAPPPETQSSGGTCTITFYGPQPLGDGSYSTTTATGTTCSQGRTCAADWSIYPPGTTIYIENDPLGGDGYYTVEDCGPGVVGNHIDIYVDDVSAYSTTSRTVSAA